MIEKTSTQLQQRIAAGLTTAEKAEDLRQQLDMGLEEYCNFQELKSLATTDGTLSLEEGTTIYGYLGNSLDTFNKQPLAVKSVLTKIHHELLAKMIKARGR
jgi:hypothetical protein